MTHSKLELSSSQTELGFEHSSNQIQTTEATTRPTKTAKVLPGRYTGTTIQTLDHPYNGIWSIIIRKAES